MKFMNHLTFGQYVPAQSIIHAIDPRCKIIGTIFLLTGIFLVKHPLAFGVWGLFFAHQYLSRLPLSLFFVCAACVYLSFFTAVIHFFYQGDTHFSMGHYYCYKRGFSNGCLHGPPTVVSCPLC